MVTTGRIFLIMLCMGRVAKILILIRPITKTGVRPPAINDVRKMIAGSKRQVLKSKRKAICFAEVSKWMGATEPHRSRGVQPALNQESTMCPTGFESMGLKEAL